MRQRPSSQQPCLGNGAGLAALDRTGRWRGPVGEFIGWLLDRWLGISPWAFIVFLLFGFAAGLINLMRSAGVLGERNWKR